MKLVNERDVYSNSSPLNCKLGIIKKQNRTPVPEGPKTPPLSRTSDGALASAPCFFFSVLPLLLSSEKEQLALAWAT